MRVTGYRDFTDPATINPEGNYTILKMNTVNRSEAEALFPLVSYKTVQQVQPLNEVRRFSE